MSRRLELRGGPCGGMALGMADLAAVLASRGWTEATGGNISVCLPAGTAWPRPAAARVAVLPEPVPELDGRCLAITATGSRFRDLGSTWRRDVVFLRLRDGGRSWEGPDDPLPTSELISHLMAHRTALGLGLASSALVHAHPASVTALSMAPLPSRSLDQLVLAAHPEVGLLMRGGVRFLDYLPPGSAELGRATADLLEGTDCVVWRRHGIVSLGADLERALDWIEIAEKAASMVLLRMSAFGAGPTLPSPAGGGSEEG